MNKYILCSMDRKNKTEEELRENEEAADATADAAAYIAAYAADADGEYWINRYFKITGENREDYEKALEAKK